MGRRTSGRLAECIRQAARTGENQSLFDGAGYVPSWDADACIRPDLGLADLPEDLSGRKVLVIGEQVIAGSLLSAGGVGRGPGNRALPHRGGEGPCSGGRHH